MTIINKVDERKAQCDEVMNFINSLSNPEIEEHVNTLPIPPQAKEFFISLTKTVILIAKEIID